MDAKYDVVIVGAGISGLVCGCYLTKNQKKVLIVEKNDHPGGCCTSFTKNGHRFDAAAHSLGGMNIKGPIGSVLKDIGIDNVPLRRINPSYILRINDYNLTIWNKFEDTVRQLREDFKREDSQIKKFFEFISSASSIALIKIKNLSFEDLLGQYFNCEELKAVLYSPLLGNTGLDPKRVSSFTAVKFYQQYVFDGGYHLDGGMQTLSDLLMKRFCEYGGKIRLSTAVEKILIQNNKAVGVQIKDRICFTQYVVSNVDGRTTFYDLIGSKHLYSELIEKIYSLRLSSSMYMLYIGLKDELESKLVPQVTHWFVNDYDIDKVYENVNECRLTFDWCAMRISQNKKSLQVFTIAPIMDKTYWEENDSMWMERLLESIIKELPSLASNIDFMLAANPQTIFRWTGNQGGATCGWESSPDQFNIAGLSQKTKIDNLYLTGHWTTITLGIPGVTNIGKSTAILILQKGKDQ